MSVYVVVQVNIHDREKFNQYRKVGGAAVAKHGGTMVAGGPGPYLLEGAGPAPDLLVLLEFPSEDAAKAWRSDEELAETHALRNASGESTALIVPSK